LETLDRDWDLEVIGQSLADNGYFVEEPLIVMSKGSEYIAIEGNRRLATLKLLLDPELRAHSKNRAFWDKLQQQLTSDLSEVPVVIYERREDVTAFLGYRHISGIVKWEPLSKARFIDSLVGKGKKGQDFAEIGREIGIRPNTARRHYLAYRIFLQARDEYDIDTSLMENKFGVFYRALSSLSITKFIGLEGEKSPNGLREPIPRTKALALKEVIEYVHGTKDVIPVITDSRQITMLGEVLESKPALSYLRVNRNLLAAWQLTGGQENRLVGNLQSAAVYLDEALRDSYRFKGSEKARDAVLRCARSMFEILRNYPEVRKSMESQD
jgi:hypothetical protein